MKYKVTARAWNDGLIAKFGKDYSIHELSDLEIVEAIMSFGRAEINKINDELRQIEFQNDYD